MHKGWRQLGYRVGPWYDRGADALATLEPNCGWAYACPLCLRAFLPPAMRLLTREHVPSKLMGGRPLLLTCKQCNEHAGRNMQKDQRRRQNITDVMQGRMATPHNITLTVANAGGTSPLRLGAAVVTSGRDMRFRPSKRTSRKHTDKLHAKLDSIADTTDWQFGMQFSSDRFHPRAASVGFLRDAYLAAFAVWGYNYILQPQLRVVREQIAAPRDPVIERFHSFDPGADPDQRWIAVVTSPKEWRCILVAFGRDRVVLPRPDTPVDIYAASASMAEGVRFTATPLGWPRTASYRFDVPKATKVR